MLGFEGHAAIAVSALGLVLLATRETWRPYLESLGRDPEEIAADRAYLARHRDDATLAPPRTESPQAATTRRKQTREQVLRYM